VHHFGALGGHLVACWPAARKVQGGGADCVRLVSSSYSMRHTTGRSLAAHSSWQTEARADWPRQPPACLLARYYLNTGASDLPICKFYSRPADNLRMGRPLIRRAQLLAGWQLY